MAKRATLEFRKRDVRLKDVPLFYKELMENKVSVGVHKEQGQENLQKALWNEFGSYYTLQRNVRKRLANGKYITLSDGSKILTPARPFLRLTLKSGNMQLIKECFENKINQNIRGGLHAPKTSANNVLREVGEGGQVAQWSNMEEWTQRLPNAQLTIDIKGFDHPLVRTGKLFNAIKYKIRKV